MTFPAIVNSANQGLSSGSSWVITLPSSPSAGNGLLVIIGTATSGTTFTWPAGWTEIGANAGGLDSFSVGYKVSTGGETTVTVTGSTTSVAASVSYQLSGVHSQILPSFAKASEGSFTNHDPPSGTAWWGALDTMWFAGAVRGSQVAPTAYPTSYSLGQLSQGQSTTVSVAAAARQNAVATEDPANFTWAASASGTAFTVAVPPSFTLDYPTVISSAVSTSTTAASSHALPLPAGIQAGDLLIATISTDADRCPIWPSGWNPLMQTSQSGNGDVHAAYYRAAGGESGTFTVTVVGGNSVRLSSVCYRITNAHSTLSPEVLFVNNTTGGSTGDPPSITPSWGSAKNLFIAASGQGSNRTVTAFPTNYGQGQAQTLVNNNSAMAGRWLEAASDDPGTFTYSSTGQVLIFTIAVPPPTVSAGLHVAGSMVGFGPSGTSTNMPLPPNIAAGDLLVMFTGPVAFTAPTGWSILGASEGTPVSQIIYRVADGSEGATVTISHAATRLMGATYKIKGQASSGFIEKGTVANTSTTTPNPPSLTPSWGSAENLWLIYTHRNGAQQWCTPPANYNGPIYTPDGGGNRVIETMYLKKTAATEDPPAFTWTASTTHSSNTVAIKPAPTLINGVADLTEDNDTLAGTAALALAGTLARTEDNDTLAAVATIKISATASLTEADDTSAGAAALQVKGVFAKTEDNDTLAATGKIALAGALAKTEADDTLAATGKIAITGVASITEANDTSAGAATLQVKGVAAITEQNDTLAASGVLGVVITGTANLTEADDTLAATGVLTALAAITGVAAITEADDVLAATGVLTGVQPPVETWARGAWISDEKVERARERKWKYQRQAQRELRQALDDLVHGRRPEARQALAEARNEIEMALLFSPGIDPALVQMRADLMALMSEAMRRQKIRDMIESLEIQAQIAEAEADEEAAIVSLLMAGI